MFRSFLLQAKRYKGFPVTGRYQCHCYQCSFIYKTVSQFFGVLIFSQDLWGNIHVPEINLISSGTLIKAFYLLNRKFKRNLRHGFVDERQLKIIMPNKCFPKHNLYLFTLPSQCISSNFLSEKFTFQTSFEKISFFNSKYLTFLSLFISLLKNTH